MNPGSVRRKLTTILASDVAGYSRLMSEDEEATLATLKEYREIMFGLINRHEGRVFGTAGDSVVAEFGSAVEAVRCAISIQEELRARNAETEENRQMHFRVGVSLGDVMVEGDDLFGDGVNVAARLEGVAPPGGICISGSVFEQVKNKLSLGFEDIGPQKVKNIAEPVPAFQVVPARVSVASAEPPARGTDRKRNRALAAALVLAVFVGGAAVWAVFLRGPAPDSLQAIMAGVTIQGTTNQSRRPFTIRLIKDQTAELSAGPTPDGLKKGFLESGKWWVDNEKFCMQFTRFAQGRAMCPEIAIEKGLITAYGRRDGTPTGWTFIK